MTRGVFLSTAMLTLVCVCPQANSVPPLIYYVPHVADGAQGSGHLRWCLLQNNLHDLGGDKSALAVGDVRAAVPKVQLVFIDADYGTSRPDAAFDKGPWTAEMFRGAIKVCTLQPQREGGRRQNCTIVVIGLVITDFLCICRSSRTRATSALSSSSSPAVSWPLRERYWSARRPACLPPCKIGSSVSLYHFTCTMLPNSRSGVFLTYIHPYRSLWPRSP